MKSYYLHSAIRQIFIHLGRQHSWQFKGDTSIQRQSLTNIYHEANGVLLLGWLIVNHGEGQE